jgi:hypothetical protein
MPTTYIANSSALAIEVYHRVKFKHNRRYTLGTGPEARGEHCQRDQAAVDLSVVDGRVLVLGRQI